MERDRDSQTARLHINHLTQSGGEANTQAWPAPLQPQPAHKRVFCHLENIVLTHIQTQITAECIP